MKKIKNIVMVLVILFAFSSFSYSQTKQVELYATCNDYVWCLNKVLHGDWTYHFTYHVDKKTGVITSVHWNVKDCDLVDNEGNIYKLIDTGNDNLGLWWDFFNNINANNTGDVHYTLEDGWLDQYLPGEGEWPEDGRIAPSVLKFIGKHGDIVTYKSFIKGYRTEDGELVISVEKYVFDCN